MTSGAFPGAGGTLRVGLGTDLVATCRLPSARCVLYEDGYSGDDAAIGANHIINVFNTLQS